MSKITSINDQTFSKFISAYGKNLDLEQIINYQDPIIKVINWDKIQRNYTDDELAENTSKYNSKSYSDILVKSGTSIELNFFFLKRDYIKIPSSKDVVKATQFNPFIVSRMKELLEDPDYIRVNDSNDGGQVTTANVGITVYMWCRSLSAPGSDAQEGSWIDISSFVQLVHTQVDAQQGSFVLTLSPVSCRYDEILGWVPDQSSNYDYGSASDDTLSQQSIINNHPITGSYRRSSALFNTIIQENDLVYIRFEKLSIDQQLETRLRSSNSKISGNDISERIWDMIGLVDTISTSTSPGDSVTTVVGRDIMKIWIEDGSYFFPSQIAQNIFTNQDSILTKRNLMEGISNSLVGYAVSFKSIDLMLKFIFNKFSNLGIVPNSVFNGYGYRAVKDKYELRSTQAGSKGNEIIDELNQQFLKEKRQGIYRIIELVFDPSVFNRILADPGISHDNGPIINSARKLCQQPFVEFYGDTCADKYWFIIRKPPFDKKGYTGLVYNSAVVEEKNKSTKVKKDDKKIKANSARAQRSQKASDKLISDLVIDIDDSDIISEPQLSYHQEAYSWYRVVPRGFNLFEESEFRLAPVVPFDEYAKVWGNRALSIEYNYLPADFLLDSQYKSNLDFAEAQIFYDLQYLIQSNQYLPFTRRGTIQITGNRLIKRGLFIHLKSTNEIFYVDSVIHDRTPNSRTTTLRVSRGMKEPFIKGKYVQFASGAKKVSYFSIINTNIANDASLNNNEFLKNWRVDVDVFNFFLQRRQWKE